MTRGWVSYDKFLKKIRESDDTAVIEFTNLWTTYWEYIWQIALVPGYWIYSWNGAIWESEGWVADHSALSNLDFEHAGHIGFASEAMLADYEKLAISTTQDNLYTNLIPNNLLIPDRTYLVSLWNTWEHYYIQAITTNTYKSIRWASNLVAYEQTQFDLNYDNEAGIQWNRFDNREKQQVVIWTTTNENQRGIANATKVTLHSSAYDMFKRISTTPWQEYTFSIRAKFDTVTNLAITIMKNYLNWNNCVYYTETNKDWRQKCSVRFVAESTSTVVFIGWMNNVWWWVQQTAGDCYLCCFKCEASEKTDEMNFLPVFDLLRWVGRDYRATAGWVNNGWTISVGYPDVVWIKRASAITFASEAQAQMGHYYNITNRVPTLEVGKNYIYGIRLNKVFAWNIVITLADNNWRFEYPQLVDNNLWWRQYYELEFTYKWNWLFFYFWGSGTIRQTAWTFYMYWLTLRQAPLPLVSWVQEIIAGDWIAVDNSDPSAPVVSAVGWWNWAVQRFEYWQLTIAKMSWQIIPTMSAPWVNAWYSNKDININLQKYLKCFVDIIEYQDWYEVQRRNKMRFANQDDIFLFCSENCSTFYNENDVLSYSNTIIALFYDIIDWSIQWIPKVNGWNTFYQMLRWKHRELATNAWLRHLQIVWNENQRMPEPLYYQFIQMAFDNMFPERWLVAEEWLYDWPIGSLFWFGASYKKRFNLLKANATIHPIESSWNSRSYLKYDLTVPEYTRAYWVWDSERTIDQSRTKYIWYEMGTSYWLELANKNEVSILIQRIKAENKSIVILYCLTRQDPINASQTQYAIYVKPVNIDTLYVSPFDDSLYELNAVCEWDLQYQKLQIPYFSSMTPKEFDSVRIQKWNRYALLWRKQRNLRWSKNPSVRFMLRRLSDWMIWPITKQRAVFEWPRRDRPITTKISYT